MTRHLPITVVLGVLLSGSAVGCGDGTDRPPPGYGADDDAAITTCDDPRYGVAVQPVFQARCGQCHRPNAPLGGLSLHEYQAVMAGGQSGPVVIPERCAESLLYQLIAGQALPAMPPPGYERVPAADGACLCAWIEEGALGG